MTVKVRLRRGTREIEIEGSREDVDSLLATWWSPPTDAEDEGPEEESEEPTSRTEGRGQRRKPGRRVPSRSVNPAAGFDTAGLANKIKESGNFDQLQEHVFHKNDRFRKVAAVLNATEEYLGAAEITDTLTELGTPANANSIRNMVNESSGRLLSKSRGTGTVYQLTSKERSAFTAWMEVATKAKDDVEK